MRSYVRPWKIRTTRFLEWNDIDILPKSMSDASAMTGSNQELPGRHSKRYVTEEIKNSDEEITDE